MSVLPLSVLQKMQVQKQVNSGFNFEDMNVDLKLSVFLKPIQATWWKCLLHNLVKEKDRVEGIVYHSKREI